MPSILRGAAWSVGAASILLSCLVVPGPDARLLGAGLAPLVLAGLPGPGPGRRLTAAAGLGMAVAVAATHALWWAAVPALLLAALWLHALGLRAGTNVVLATMSHALVVGASVLVALRRPLSETLLLAGSGLGLLALQAHWGLRAASQAQGRGGRGEPLLLLAILGASAWATLFHAQQKGWIGAGEAGGAGGGAAGVVLASWGALVPIACAGVAAAVLTLPAAWHVRRRGRPARQGSALDVAAHGSAAIALLNVLFLSFSLVSWWSLRLLLLALLLWQVGMIVMEYRALTHAARRRRRAVEAAEAAAEPVTAVIPAAGEAVILRETMQHNLAIDYPLRFVLVPAVRSPDETVQVALDIAAQHPDRVRVVVGDTGSKAGDLNAAWRHVETDLVLILDADETTDRTSLLHAVSVLRAHPEAGVVQGRKVSRAPFDGFLARFVSAERRYSTWMDHVMHGETLGSAHFGGSAALLRRQVPPELGGWTDRTLTEDIEFTLRLHLDGRWRIVYRPEFVVREADPRTFPDLLRQRTRWSRGWAQCVGLYFGDVWRARQRLGARRAFGLLLLLLVSVSALWTTFVPTTVLMRFGGVSPLLPLVVAVGLSLVLLPSRLFAYGYAALRDPVIPMRVSVGRLAELALHAYLWILLGWFVQLHALYLELSRAPSVWHVTSKRAQGGPPGPPGPVPPTGQAARGPASAAKTPLPAR